MQNHNVKLKRTFLSLFGCSFSFLALSFAFLPLAVHAQDITTDLVGHWKFDETSGTSASDSSGSNNTGTLTNGPTWTTGKIGQALEFDGVDDYVRVGDGTLLQNMSLASISAWIYPQSFNGQSRVKIYSKDNAGSGNFLVFWLENFNVTNGLAFNRQYSISSLSAISPANVINLNQWNHVAVVWDGGSARSNVTFYVNGVRQPINTGVGADGSGALSDDSGYTVSIGSNANGSEHWYDGQIDEVRVYNRALSTSDIQALYAYTGGPPDTQAPTTPTNLTASAISSSQINLSWTASTDNIGVTGYRVYRGGTQVASPSTTSYSDTGLSPSTTYSYTVAAVDAAGNVSAQSTSAQAVTQAPPPPDTTAPTQPTNFQATVISSSQINLSWTASTDNVGVTGYRVERCQGSACTTFTQIATPSTNSYNDTGLTANTTYRYQVRAADAANNLSSYSSIVSATTQAQGTGQTLILDTFESGAIRIINPSETNPGYRDLWSQYQTRCSSTTQLQCLGTMSVSSSVVHDGAYALKDHVTQGNAYVLFYTYSNANGGWGWMHDFLASGTWTPNKYNRMRFWVKVPPGITKAPVGRANVQLGTFVRSLSAGDWDGHETGGGHWYHLFNIPYTGEWHQIILDTHPHHQRGAPGFTEWGDQLHVTGESNWNYFDAMTDFYLDFYNNGYVLPSVPQDFYFDGFEIYQANANENIDQIYSLNGVYTPSTNTVYVGWSTRKDQSVNYDVRYSFQDVYQAGWAAAIPAPGGTSLPSPGDAYNGMEYQTTGINVAGQSTLYIAIKPQNSSLFRQIEISLTSGTPPPSDTTPPTISLTTPSSGSTVSGSSVTVSATASDNIGVSGVQFLLDGTNLQSEDTTSPYSILWNTTTTTNGSHTLTARARDAAGNTTTSNGVTVTVDNGPLVGDLNQDRTVNGADWTIMAGVWFTNDATADINSDGIVNSIDFSLMNANWGRTI